MPERPHRALKNALLAVAAVHEIDLLPSDDGTVLAGAHEVLVPWTQLYDVLGRRSARSPEAPAVLAEWLRVRRWVADVPDLLLGDSARILGLPVDHPLHPGLSWVKERVHGDVLDLGIAIKGLDPAAPERLVPVPESVWTAAEADPMRWWDRARGTLEAMGVLALERWRRKPDAPLVPIGDADVVTLLGATDFRRTLAAEHGGMCPAVVPMRSRGWLQLSAVDPAFAPAAAMATDPEERAYDRPLLLTAEEVALAGAGDYARNAAIIGLLPTPDFSTLRGR
ncbi:MAG TPA: hypothetical protein VHE83_17450 [Mycobacteriales bacterium]|nr:hypothetical protein [Mycobacteriales bacterium]